MRLSISLDCTLLLLNAATTQQILSSVSCRACARLLELLKSNSRYSSPAEHVEPILSPGLLWGLLCLRLQEHAELSSMRRCLPCHSAPVACRCQHCSPQPCLQPPQPSSH